MLPSAPRASPAGCQSPAPSLHGRRHVVQVFYIHYFLGGNCPGCHFQRQSLRGRCLGK